MTVTWLSGVQFTLEIGLTSNPSTAIGSTSWTDVSSYLRAFSTARGRSTEFDTFRAGTMTVTLNNTDRRFDPNNAAGPYFGNLKPMRRIRLRAIYNAVTYDVWSGFIDDWPQSYVLGDHYAEVELHCTDAFKVLASRSLPVDGYYNLVMEETVNSPGVPVAYYRLGEQSGTICQDSSGHGWHGSYGGGATFNSRTGLIAFTNDNAIGFDGVDDYAQVPCSLSAYDFSVVLWFKTSAKPAVFFYLYDPRSSSFASISLNSAAGALLAQSVDAAASRQFTTTAAYNDNAVHQVAVYFPGNLAPTVYIDGVAAAGTASGSGTQTFPTSPVIRLGATDVAFTAETIDEVAIWTGDVVTTYGIGLFVAGDGTIRAADRPPDAVDYVLNLLGWPSADVDNNAFGDDLGWIWVDALLYPGPTNALSALQTIETTEQGQLYVAEDGKITFRDHIWRHTNSTAVTSNATFGDSSTELRYADVTVDGGAQFIRNRIRVSSSGFSDVQASDATSIASYLEWPDDVSLAPMSPTTDTTAYREGLANWRLAQFKDPIQRLTRMVIKPRRADQAASLFPQVLGRKIGEKVTVKRRPPGGGSANTFTVLVEGISHDVDFDGNWVTTWYLSSSDSNASVQPLILDDTSYGLLDSNVLGF